MKIGSRLAIILFLAVALVHLARILTGTPVVIGDYPVPMWPSFLGVVVTGGLAYLLYTESDAG